MNQPDAPIKRSLGRIVLYCLLLALPISGAFLLTEKRMKNLEEEGRINIIKVQDIQNLQQQSRLIQHMLNRVKNDARFLSRLPSIANILKKGTKNALTEQVLLSMATTYGNYDQIRLINASGDEVLRVNYDDGSPRVVPQNELQNKASHSYFSDAMTIRSPDLIAISPFDLNIEHGKVEIPFKPMIRISIPIDEGESRLGVLVLNFLGNKIFKLMDELRFSSRSSVGLLNQDGYWLQGFDPEDAWGFMLPERLNRNIFNTMPDEAQKIYAQNSGQFQTESGELISFATIRPMNTKEGISSQGLNFWKLISRTPAEVINELQIRRPFALKSLIVVVTIFLATLFASVFLEERRVINKQFYRERLVDKVTGTWNRQYIAEYVTKHTSQEEKMSLALVDLGNFKKVNDLLGHDVGDQVLRQVAEIFQRCIRPEDQLSRHGGDEFLLVFPDTDCTTTEKIMKRLATAVRQEVLPDGPVTVEADWGVAQVKKGHSMKEATVEADRRMYAYKKARKERQGITD